MQKRKKIIGLLLMSCALAFTLSATACSDGKDGIDGVNGTDGKSAYQIWLDNGYTGTETEFLEWLKGEDGTDGKDGTNGIDGVNGTNGVDGKDGANGTNGVDGKSAYQIWLDNGNTGSETDFLEWLKGEDGKDGINGTNGITPTIEISDDGYWVVNNVKTECKAVGVDGQNGTNGTNGIGVKNAEIDENGDLIITFDNGTYINAGNVVNKSDKLNEENKIIFKTLEIVNNSAFIKVTADTTIYSFLNEVELKGNASYSISTDMQGLNVIPTKTVELEIGDNTFYVLETCGNDSNLYTITIRRGLHTVTFNTNGGTPIETQTVEEGTILSPVSTKNGYHLTWDYDFSIGITDDLNVNATWTAIFNVDKNSIISLTDCGKTLKEIVIPNSIDGVEITALGQRAFEFNKNFTSVIISNSITTIGEQAFNGCSNLIDLTIGEGVAFIGYSAFSQCSSLENIYINNIANWCEITIGEYGTNPLHNAKNLYLGNNLITELIIPDGVTSINDYIFLNYDNLTNVVISESVKTIGYMAFADCDNLSKIKIADSVTSISDSAFLDCDSLNELIIPDSITSIGFAAFLSCDSLTSIILGSGITSIGEVAFDDCNNLTSVYYKGTVEQWKNISLYNNYELIQATRYYYSETEPTLNLDGTAYDGNYWHYDMDGVTPVIWTVNQDEENE